MKNLKIFISLLILFIIYFCISVYSYANTISEDLSDNFFRLHIIANSNSVEDQALKLKVRDNIINYMNTLTYSDISKEEAIILTQSNIDNFKRIAEDTIRSNGFNYNVDLEIGNFYFPTKYYGNISLPSGFYDALKIKIGEASGENWWCSLFPPLCFTDISSGIIDDTTQEKLKQNLSNEEFAIITKDSQNIKLKFKIVELLSKK